MPYILFQPDFPDSKNGQYFTTYDHLYSKKSIYQKIDFYTSDFGVLFTIDDVVMLTEAHEQYYHEMIIHPALVTHKKAEKLLVIGGGDCGTIFQAIKHTDLEQITMVEIDETVIEASKLFLPHLTNALNDKRITLRIEDGFKYMEKNKNNYDVIIIDSTDPYTISTQLFTNDFYGLCFQTLNDDGILVAQSETPVLKNYDSLQKSVYLNLKKLFKHVEFLTFPMPCYPTGFFTVILASKKYNIKDIEKKTIQQKTQAMNLKYYNEDIHHAAYAQSNTMKIKLL